MSPDRYVKLYRAISNESVDGSCDCPHSSHGPPSRAEHAGLRLARVRPSCGAITTHTCSARSTAVRIKHCADWIGRRALAAAAVSGSGGGHKTRVMGPHVGLENAVSADIPVWYTLRQISRAQSPTAAAAGRFSHGMGCIAAMDAVWTHVVRTIVASVASVDMYRRGVCDALRSRHGSAVGSQALTAGGLCRPALSQETRRARCCRSSTVWQEPACSA